MKNTIKSSLLVGIFVLFAVSCNVSVDDDPFYGSGTFTNAYYIDTEDWYYDKSADLFYCDVPINELNKQVYNNGILAGYFVYYVDNQRVDSPLPYIQYFMDRGYQWSYQYTCEFYPGGVTFIFKDSNFDVSNPPSCTFVIKMMLP